MVIKTLPDPLARPNPNGLLKTQKTRRSVSATHPSIDRLDVTPQRQLPNAANFNSMCIITKNDLNRIYDNLDRRQRDKDAIQQEIARKNDMAERSAQLTRHWPNTIAGARERKLELKKIREQEDEEKRKAVDLEEEKYAAERRREQIETAKKLKYYETDRVKTFHSALLLTEVLKERELQLDMKKRIQQMRQTDEDEERRAIENAHHDFNKSEQEKREKKAQERAAITQYQLSQMERKRAQTAVEKQQDREEGEAYRQLAEQYAREHMEIERYRKATQNDIKHMYDKALENKHKIKKMEQQMDEDEDDELRIYAEAKKKIARIRREKELQAHQEKQDARDHMTGFLGTLQKRAEADYDTQIFRAQAQREAKELREEQEKHEKQQKMQESIVKHRQATMKRREAEKEMEERQEAEMNKKKEEADQLFHLYQQEKDKKRNQNARDLAELHLRQAQERKDREREVRDNEAQEVHRDKETNEIERQQFQDYAGRVISYMDENERNTYPLKKVYNEEMKRFDDLSQGYRRTGSSNSNSEKKPRSQDKAAFDKTKKNLGFQWEIPNK
ncbi:unnamed protein product [Adineta steineri]|uniref:Trichohyalin-plectin-homology domain-containing protein n=3 Tax=Adineta steineri TaxID=433720 RepID=A0A819JRH0_9BILA|nr:unnamed protein product [Adineta steineri]CAF3934068.1 unnamed protein product [Adineta steineri]